MDLVAAWLLTIALHGTVLLFAAWAIDRTFPALRCACRQLLWRTALFGCVLTATLQVASQQSPRQQWQIGGRWHLGAVSDSPVLPRAQSANQFIAASAESPSTSRHQRAMPDRLPAEERSSTALAGSLSAGPRSSPGSSRDWPAWIVGIWLGAALFAIARMTASFARLQRTLADAVTLANPALKEDLSTLATRAGIAEPRLLSLDTIPSPIAAPFARIVLPVWAIDTLDRAQLRAMLAHELAHIARGDPGWKLLTAFWRALFWFMPAAGIAQRRLDEIAELFCDAFAAQQAGGGRRLAECLAVCAERHVARKVFNLAPAMAARPSSLLHRIERLLEGVVMETASSGALARAFALIVLVASAACLPAIGFDSGLAYAAPSAPQQAPSPAPQDTSHTSVSIHDDVNVEGSLNGHQIMSVSFSDAAHKFSANVDGKIDFNTDETDVASLSADGTARFEETRDGATRRIELAARGNKLERRYFVNGTEQAYDDKARALMATAVKELMRTGIGAEARVKRLYAEGGAPRVLDEIGQIHSDYARSIYLKLLAGTGKLKPAELDRALQLSGAMHSDYERRQALSGLFDQQALDAARQITFLHQVDHFSSDYERAELLVGVVARLANADDVRQAWLDAALGVHSDYERRRTLESMLNHGGLDDAQLGSVITASASMRSDYEHRQLLVAVAQRAHDINSVAAAYTHSAQSLGSDYEHREALLALINAGKLGPKALGDVLDSATQIKSSYECREVLVALARVMPDDARLMDRYRDVAKHLSDSDRGEADRALSH
ncbi:MAG: M56 family metallopeptidase [Rudaea sp.]|nr:M56 family metallopeptidase [Rudaea sp.]